MNAESTKTSVPSAQGWYPWLFAFACGTFVALGLLKISTPAILADKVDAPETLVEWVFFSWPNLIGYAFMVALALLSLRCWRKVQNAPIALLAIPLGWLAWQILSTANTVDMILTKATVGHFVSNVALFYIGYFALSRSRDLKGFQIPLVAGFLLVLWGGLDQHFGGLQATREMIYAQPNWQQLPPEYLEKIAKDRIFSTLFYPNALAGGLIMLTPLCGIFVWRLTSVLQVPSRIVIVATVVAAALACLYWTESKSGWLVAMALVFVYALQSNLSKKIKLGALACLLVIGLTGFFWKYSDYFNKGATSVAARFEYWRAAWTTATANPLVGTGPGTFMRSYAKIKPPEAEMARLAHNDYLQQASDSGFLGALAYGAFIWISLYWTWRRRHLSITHLALWFGLLGFALQSFVEFGLYIPALSWCFFLLLGWLLGQDNPETDEIPSTATS